MDNLLNTIEFTLKKGKIERAKELLAEYYKKLNKQEWLQDKQAEYNELYPSQRDMTDDEKTAYDTDKNGSIIERDEGFEYPKIPIYYFKEEPEDPPTDGDVVIDPSYKTFDEWLNETKVIKEAVTDEDGNVIEPEVTELVRPYTEPSVEEINTKVQEYLNGSELYKEYKKKKEKENIAKATVTVGDKVFDANLEARQNMADAILAANYAGQTETVWRMADNSEVTVTIDELKQAHLLALQKYAEIKGISG